MVESQQKGIMQIYDCDRYLLGDVCVNAYEPSWYMARSIREMVRSRFAGRSGISGETSLGGARVRDWSLVLQVTIWVQLYASKTTQVRNIRRVMGDPADYIVLS